MKSLMLFSVVSLWLLTLFSSTSVSADERILSFASDITVYADGSMEVKDTIRVRVENKKIKRGIYRDFPTRYKDNWGNDFKVKFDVRSVLRDGVAEDYFTETESNGIRLYLGRKNYVLPIGEYTYTITYRTNRQLGFFEDHDELYWNATGNGWVFPMDKVTITVQLPDDIPFGKIAMEAYTGLSGSKGQDYQTMLTNDGRAQFVSNRTLNSYEGLTIVASWPKGYIKEPDFRKKMGYILDDNYSLFLGLIGLIIISVYYFLVWKKVGKDPEAGVIFPHYYPPTGYSPASMRYISRMGYDHKAFATAVVNLAVKGALTINETKKQYSLTKNSSHQAKLAAGEKVLMEKLFSDGNSLTLKNTNHSLIQKAISAHKRSLKNDYQKIYFKMNSVWLLPGVISSIGVIVLIFLNVKANAGPETLFLLLWLSAWTIGVVAISRTAFMLWKKALNGGSFLGAIAITLFAIPFFGAETFVIMHFNFSIPLVFTIAAITTSNILFYHLLKAPTRAGRKLLDKIEGFKMYLDVAEKDELNLKNPPEKTPEIFEIYLSYAMALDVEQKWADKFAGVFENLQQGGNGYHPSWYHGSHWNSHNLGGFTTAVGSSLSSAIASSSTAPGSSSGSGGGGSSGGGGGGGGGGGW